MRKNKFAIFTILFPVLVAVSLFLYYLGIFGPNQSDNSSETRFYVAFEDSLLYLASTSECFETEDDPSQAINCVIERNALARSVMQPFLTERGCVGEISSRVIEVTEIMDEISRLSLDAQAVSDTESLADVERKKEVLQMEANKRINEIQEINFNKCEGL